MGRSLHPQVKNKYKDIVDWSQSVNIMRPGPYGNPFVIGRDGTRDEVCDKFEKWALKQLGFVLKVREELKGKDLVCCCEPLRCHGRWLLKIANE